ncbi:D-ribose pyranase [Streptomyces sp. NPDC046977]|uniref:D-ribose pyranase n=1 Tax=Streptomyces sp. NPDC046977 TaxID=3154703 RepID=UPI00340AEC80
MKKSGILNRHLAGALAALGHTDLVVVCDAGLPIPPGPVVVDLAFRAGTPSFAEVLKGLQEELVIEGAVAAKEVREHNPEVTAQLEEAFPDLELVPHEDFKALTHRARLVVRTGEARPYANVVLRCGVPF